MNMKKTIAAIAAGAVAVSAMATTVSALETRTFTYNLVRTEKIDDAKGTVVYSYVAKDLVAAVNAVDIDLADIDATYGTVKNVVVYVDYDASAGITTADRSVFRFANGVELGFQDAKTDITTNKKVTIPANALSQVADTKAQFTVEVTVEHTYEKEDQVKALAVPTIAIGAGAVEPDYAVIKAITVPTKKEVKYPFMTSINANQQENILDYLENDGNSLYKDDHSYPNVTAVINDAIENFDSVTFTFATAKEPVNAAGEYDKDGDKQYLAFAEHLYNWFYTPEDSTYTGFAWNGVNLFSGALVVNEYQTMSLADTEKFDYSKTTLTFDWDAVEEGVATSNAYARYIHSLKLATSSTWYWDNLTITCTNDAEEDTVDTEAPTTSDDEELGEEEVEEETEEVTEEEAEEETEAEVEVENPTTGNASVALAVIPVALAAAAVVAKKRS